MMLARDKYVAEQTKEMLFTMREQNIPKGVKFSFIMMSTPLVVMSTYLALLTPLISTGQIPPH